MRELGCDMHDRGRDARAHALRQRMCMVTSAWGVMRRRRKRDQRADKFANVRPPSAACTEHRRRIGVAADASQAAVALYATRRKKHV